jgi:hypothetical protein
VSDTAQRDLTVGNDVTAGRPHGLGAAMAGEAVVGVQVVDH